MTKFKNIKEWFIRDYIKSEILISKSMDLDYFLERNNDPLCFVKKGIEMLNELIELCENQIILDNIMPRLFFPLKYIEGDKLITFNPITFSLKDELDEMSPGDICLVKRDEAKYCVFEERYECAIQIEWPINLHKNCIAYYGCFRDEEDLKHNYEFSRYIRIDHYTDNLLKFYKEQK